MKSRARGTTQAIIQKLHCRYTAHRPALLKEGLTGSRKRAGVQCVCVCLPLPMCVRASLSVCLCLCLFLWVMRATDARLVQRDNHEWHKGNPSPNPSLISNTSDSLRPFSPQRPQPTWGRWTAPSWPPSAPSPTHPPAPPSPTPRSPRRGGAGMGAVSLPVRLRLRVCVCARACKCVRACVCDLNFCVLIRPAKQRRKDCVNLIHSWSRVNPIKVILILIQDNIT